MVRTYTKPKANPPHQMRRCFLFLQGHPSAFWRQLADALHAQSHAVHKINFSLADQVFWGFRKGDTFRRSLQNFPSWLDVYLREHGITDILYYGDGHPYHKVAATVGRARGLGCWVVEHGYLRPDWLTLEPYGMGERSTFPRHWSEIEEFAAGVDPIDARQIYRHSFVQEAFGEVSYNLLQAAGRPLFPKFVSDRVYWPIVDYLSWLPHLCLEKKRNRAANYLVRDLDTRKKSFNLVALQLQSDYMVRQSKTYSDLGKFVQDILTSFKLHAPPDRHLIFKIHPLDSGLEFWFRRIPREAGRLGVASRVNVVRGGALDEFIRQSQGVILLNSTVGIHALRAGKPTCALGQSIFTLKGLTHQSGLDAFWTNPEAPDPDRFAVFERAIAGIQIRGSFYDRAGRQAAIDEMCVRLTTTTVDTNVAALDILDHETAVSGKKGSPNNEQTNATPKRKIYET